MVATPQFLQPNGTYSTDPVYTTTRELRFFNGTIDADSSSVFVSINGRDFTNDPDLVTFEGTSFTVPTAAAYPSGLELLAGKNTIAIKVKDTAGNESNVATATVTLVQDSDVGLVTTPPTGLVVEQLDGKITLTVNGIDDTQVQGYNFYASTVAGGGPVGYMPLNINLVTAGTVKTSNVSIGTLTFDGTVKVDSAGDQVATPQYVNVLVSQQDINGTVLQTDANELLKLDYNAAKYKLTATVDEIQDTTTYSFTHDRAGVETSTPATVPNGEFAALPDTSHLYYIATAVYYDDATRTEVESSASAELAARPIKVSTLVGSLPAVGRQQVVESMVLNILRSQPQIAVQPGSVLRDGVIDPMSSEIERVRLVLDFLHRSSSFTTLLEIDDPNGSGTSIPVSESSYKVALQDAFMLTSEQDVQDLIDGAFDKLAANFGEARSAGKAAVGTVTFYTSTAPTSTLSIPIGATVGGGSVEFVVQQAAAISPSNAATTYNPSTSQYAVTVPVQAASAGTAGNVGSGQINTPLTGTTGLRVTNTSATYGGTEQDSNHTLAVRAMRKLASVDSGTKQGYYNIAANSAGVTKVEAVEAGNALMQRDYDKTLKKHIGGKVDLWVQGEQLATVSETFAFDYQKAENIQFTLEGDPANLLFRAEDPNLSAANPLTEMLDNSSAGYGLRNITQGTDFVLTGATYPTYNTVQLDVTQAQPAVAIGDVVLGDYRYKVSSKYVPAQQPVRSLTSLVSAKSIDDGGSGTLASSLYKLHRANSPLGVGRSTLGAAYVEVTDDGTSSAPAGLMFTVSAETHTMVGTAPVYLSKLGINSLTIVVRSPDLGTTYSDPWAANPDYTIVEGTQTTPVSILRTAASTIPSGSSVSVSYQHTENFTLTYTHNTAISVFQTAIESARHITADVLVKEAIPVPVDITANIVMKQGQDAGVVDESTRTNLANFFSGLRLGGKVWASDIVEVLDSTDGVSHIELPMIGLYLASGSLVTREALTVNLSSDAFLVTSWSTPTVNTWLLKNPLTYATDVGGGPTNEYRAVYEDDFELTLRTTDPNLLSAESGRAYIYGKDGGTIPGYTGNTKNTVLITLPTGESPTSYKYAVTYVVGSDSGVKVLNPGPAGYLTSGTLDFTYTTADGR